MRVLRLCSPCKKLIIRSICIILAVAFLYVVTYEVVLPPIPRTTTPMPPLAHVMAPREWYVVPNIVHFLRLGDAPLTFLNAVCILAVLKHQRPEKLYVHTDQFKFEGGKYWDVVKENPFASVVQVKYFARPYFVFGQKLANKRHSGNVARLRILMEHGGIYLDNDCYLVKNLNELRRFDMTLSWQNDHRWLSDRIIIASKSARLLQKWFDGYRYYNSDSQFNAVIFPTNILITSPDLAHVVTRGLGDYKYDLLTSTRPNWKDQYAVYLTDDHLSGKFMTSDRRRRSPLDINETNIVLLKAAIRDMVSLVYPIQFPSTNSGAMTRSKINSIEGKVETTFA